MIFKYDVGNFHYKVELVEKFIPLNISGGYPVLLHTTPRKNKSSILKKGLLIGLPCRTSLVETNAVFLTIPSDPANTNDAFRYHPETDIIIVVDASVCKNIVWYIDFFMSKDITTINRGENRHVMTLQSIPSGAIRKIVDELENAVKIAWYHKDSDEKSNIHLTIDGVETLCGGHAMYIANRKLTRASRRNRGMSRFCNVCFADKQRRNYNWDHRCL
jgi:hypothetical protein